MKNVFFAVLLATGSVIYSCAPSSTKESAPSETSQAAETPTDCEYQVLSDQVAVHWTAYKTTDKIAVSGTFDSVDVIGVKPASSLEEALKNITVIVNTASVNSNNPERDGKIIKFFFGLFKNADKITGDIVTVQGDENRGELALNLTMNGITQEILVPYVQERGVLVFQTDIDLSEWSADSSVASLNRACHDLHTGPDGISKLWPTVRLEVRAPFRKQCP